MEAAGTGTAGEQEKLAPNSSAQQRLLPRLSPRLTKIPEQVSRLNFESSYPIILDANTSLAESESWHGSCWPTGEHCAKQKRALDDVNSLLDKVLLR